MVGILVGKVMVVDGVVLYEFLGILYVVLLFGLLCWKLL